jgi:hypothetical protein
MNLFTDKKKLTKRIKIVEPQTNPKRFKAASNGKEENKNGSKGQKPEKKASNIKSNGSSIDEGKKMFEWLITPEPVDEFMR